MNERLEALVGRCREAGPAWCAGQLHGLSDGERCFVALAAGRYGLLRDPEDPVEAWHRLPPHWRAEVCAWRGWPEEWAND
jgi:hypothetical protein